MADLKAGEAYTTGCYIVDATTGAAATGLAPTSILIKVSDGTRTTPAVTEVSDGIYKATFTPDAISAWALTFAVAGNYNIYGAVQLYKVGGGNVGDIETAIAALNDLAQADILADATPFNGASIAAILADVTAINGDAMRGTDGAATAAIWTNALATALASYTAVRGGYLDELAAANLPTDVANVAAAIAALNDLAQADILADATPFNGASIAAILADVTAINGDAMRGTDAAATAAVWTNALATALAAYTAVRGGYLDELAAANLPSDVDDILTDVEEAHERAFKRVYPLASTSESVANAAEVSLAAPAVVTPVFPTGATRLNSYVVATLKANNQTAAEHNVGVTLQRNIAAGGWVDLRDFTANPPITLPAVDATSDALTLVEVIAITTGQSIQFRWQVDSDNAGEVHYVQSFVYVLEYDFQ